MKNTVIRIVVFCVVFLGSLLLFNQISTKGKTEMTAEMNQATLPVLYLQAAEENINCLHGYTDNMDASLLRDSVTPLEGTNTFTVLVKPYGNTVENMSYELIKGDGTSTLEKGTVKSFENSGKNKLADIKLKTKMEDGSDYVIKFILKPESGIVASYYTRLHYEPDMHVKEQLEFVNYFHDTTFKKGSADELSKYLETSLDGVNNNLNNVNIHSNLESVTWANLKPTQESTPDITIKSITEDTAVVEMRYVISAKNSKGTEYYNVIEYFKVKYSPDRMYLLEYERSQSEYFNPQLIDTGRNAFKLGITNNQAIESMTSSDCEKTVFVQERQLWYYDYKNVTMTKVFSFRQDDIREARNDYDQHDIHIIRFTDDGEIIFTVYGYMNRGRHEGTTGIALYRFDPDEGSIEELLYVPASHPYQTMKDDVKQLMYLNNKQIFFFVLDGRVHRVDCTTKEVSVLGGEVNDESCAASKDQSIVAIQNKMNPAECTSIKIYNLKTGKTHTIKAAKGHRIKLIGFVSKRILYGIANNSDIKNRDSDNVVFPMKKIQILEQDLSDSGTYEKSGIYIMDATVNGQAVELTRGVKKGKGYEETTPDIIIRKETTDKDTVTFSLQYSQDNYNQLYMIYPNYIYITKAPKVVVTREALLDDYRTVTISQKQTSSNKYFVYANGQMGVSYGRASQAIEDAADKGGSVINGRQQTIWESNATPDYAGIAQQVPTISSRDVKDSKIACVAMILQYENIKAEYTTLAEQQGSIDEILNQYMRQRTINLSGCSLSQVLYYIGKGAPVIAQLKKDHFVLVTSYNGSSIRYTDPVTGDVIKDDRSKVEALLSDKVFYSYLK